MDVIEPRSSAAAANPPTRDRALDLARGLAVVGMVWSHFVPSEGATTLPGELATLAARQCEDKSAALFCLLAGMAWALQGNRTTPSPRQWLYVARRALAMLTLGGLLGYCLWPTEILMPLALMFVATMALRRLGTMACLCAALLVVAAVPPVMVWFGHFGEQDWLDDGSPRMWTSFGAVTLRYFVFDGNYPLLPWLCFPLVGSAWVASGATPSRCGRWLVFTLPLALAMQAWSAWATDHADRLGDLAVHLQTTWGPMTTVPFAAQNLAWSAAIVAALVWWQARRGLSRAYEPLVLVGRASLTHYVLHLVVVFAPLRLWYPDKDWDWSIGVGVILTLGYVAITVPLTVLWFRFHRRGPLEAVLSWLSDGR